MSSAVSTGKSRIWTVLITVRRGAKVPFRVGALSNLVCSILAEAPFQKVGAGFSEVSILFCKDREIHRLNRDYRGKDKPTDVLSFAQEDQPKGAGHSPSLGDLVISVDTARRQAREFKVTYRQEILRLIIHGLLHLAGYDHEKVPAKVAQRMRRAEERLFSSYK